MSSSLGLETLVKVAVHHDRCEKIQELSENVTKLKDLMKENLGKFSTFTKISPYFFSTCELNHSTTGPKSHWISPLYPIEIL